MIEVFSEQLNEDEEALKLKAGLDVNDFDDLNIQEIVDVYNEVKLGLDTPSEESDEESEEEME